MAEVLPNDGLVWDEGQSNQDRAMAEPINLNKARKAKARANKQQRASENRIKFGRTKAEKARDKLTAERSRKALDQAARDDER